MSDRLMRHGLKNAGGGSFLSAFVLFVPALIAVAAGLYINRFGADVTPDGAVYLTAGMRAAHGEGISMPNGVGAPLPMTQFPPLFPLVIAAFDRFDLPLFKTVGVLNAFCWGLTVLIVSTFVRGLTGCNGFLGVMAGLIVASNAIAIELFGYVLSEPLFILLLLGWLGSSALWCREHRMRWAVMAGGFAGCALLTRYAGVSLIMTTVLLMLARRGLRWPQKLLAAAVFTAIASGPGLAWGWHHRVAGQSAVNRTLAWHLIIAARLAEGVHTLAAFVIPEGTPWRPPAAVVLVGAAGLIVAGILIAARTPGTPQTVDLAAPLVRVSGAFIAVYFVFLAASISFVDEGTPLDQRILAVGFIPLVIICAALLHAAAWDQRPVWVRTIVGAILAVLLALHATATAHLAAQRKDPSDLVWSEAADSPLLEAIRDLPPNALLFSNKPAAIYMLCRRTSEDLPDRPANGGAETSETAAAIEDMRDALGESTGYVALWNKLEDFGDDVLQESDIRRNFSVSSEQRLDDGVVLGIRVQTAADGTGR